jgi:DNA-binding NarL/FixJ family response regulator
VSVSVIVVDDFPLVLEGISGVLNAHPGIRVAGTAGTATDGLALAAEVTPDVVVLDLYMPDMSGTRMLAELRQRSPDVKVLMVTASEKADTLLDAVAAGASGYLTKRASSKELCEAVLTVASGGSVITPALAGHLLREYSRSSRGEAQSSSRVVLASREQQVLALIAQGHTDREIASEMHVSPRTVQNHLMRIREKTGLRRRSELTHWAVRNSVV